jgi:hypothetical protein
MGDVPKPYYQVAVASGHDGCFACKQGRFWTVVYFEAGDPDGVEIGTGKVSLNE